jgi:hypothetical protein
LICRFSGYLLASVLAVRTVLVVLGIEGIGDALVGGVAWPPIQCA